MKTKLEKKYEELITMYEVRLGVKSVKELILIDEIAALKQQEVPMGIKRYDLIQSGYPLPDHGKMIERKNGRYCEFDAIQRSKVTDEMIEKQSEIEIDPGIVADFNGNTLTALRRRIWSYGAQAVRDNLIK